MACPAEDVLIDLAGGRITVEQRESVERHVDACDICRAALAALVAAPAPNAPAQPAARRTPSRAESQGGEDPPVASPAEALRHDEVRRTKWIAMTALSVGLPTLAATPFLAGDPLAKRLLYAAAIPAFGTFFWLLYASRLSRYTRHRMAIAWPMGFFSVGLATIYFGVFSVAPAAAVFGLSFLGLGSSLRLALACYAAFAAPHATMSVACITGVLEDPGLITLGGGGVGHQLLVFLLLHVLLVMTIVLSRLARRSVRGAMTDLDHAVRSIARREALFDEARQELERALRGGGSGRFTGQMFGSYRLGELIGRGGMGEVYEGLHRETGAAAAVKVLHASAIANPAAVRRFLREARVASSLQVPNIVRVLETGDDTEPIPYLAMERLEGNDLAHILRQERQLDPGEVVSLVRQVGVGITAAGEAGVVHRDLKPHNVFESRGAWKIVDFGASKLLDEDSTTHGALIGTPVYMAPEQAAGGAVDHRADLYGLAAIAYRALTGAPPYRAGELTAVLYRMVHTMPVRPSRLADLPPEVDAVLLIAMAKRPDDRFATADELASALAAALEGRLSASHRTRAQALGAKHPWSPANPGHLLQPAAVPTS